MYRCGGRSSWHGSCGASDCLTCHPRGYEEEDEEPKEVRGIHRVTVQRAAKDYPSTLAHYAIKKGEMYRKEVTRYYTERGAWGKWITIRRPMTIQPQNSKEG